MPATSVNGLRYPASSAAPNVNQDIQNLATDVEGKLPRVYSAQGITEGTSPTGDKPQIIKAFSVVSVAGTGGGATIVFPGGAFPNGVASVVFTAGDILAADHGFTVISDVSLPAVNVTHYKANSAGTVASGTGVRVNCIAIGW